MFLEQIGHVTSNLLHSSYDRLEDCCFIRRLQMLSYVSVEKALGASTPLVIMNFVFLAFAFSPILLNRSLITLISFCS